MEDDWKRAVDEKPAKEVPTSRIAVSALEIISENVSVCMYRDLSAEISEAVASLRKPEPDKG